MGKNRYGAEIIILTAPYLWIGEIEDNTSWIETQKTKNKEIRKISVSIEAQGLERNFHMNFFAPSCHYNDREFLKNIRFVRDRARKAKKE